MQDIPTIVGGLNWVDAVVLTLVLFYAIEGYALGAVFALFDLLKFVASFVGGLKLYWLASWGLTTFFHIPKGYSATIGFFLVSFAIELLLHISFRSFVKKVNKNIYENKTIPAVLNNILGIFPGMLSGVILLMFLLTVLTGLPVSPFLKNALSSSKTGSFLIARSQVVEHELNAIFGSTANDTLNFLTVEPLGNTVVSLDFSQSNGAIDVTAEKQMLADVNKERVARGQTELSLDSKLQTLARDYAKYMLSHGYFSHYTPEGLSPFDRMSARDILYQYAGENLAFSVNEQLAIQGLMNSKGHRDNILSPNFHRVGIGVVDAGIYGEMFVQEFTD